jgi:hypothetical protein
MLGQDTAAHHYYSSSLININASLSRPNSTQGTSCSQSCQTICDTFLHNHSRCYHLTSSISFIIWHIQTFPLPARGAFNTTIILSVTPYFPLTRTSFFHISHSVHFLYLNLPPEQKYIFHFYFLFSIYHHLSTWYFRYFISPLHLLSSSLKRFINYIHQCNTHT